MMAEPMWMSGHGSAAEDEIEEPNEWDAVDEAYDNLKEQR